MPTLYWIVLTWLVLLVVLTGLLYATGDDAKSRRTPGDRP